MTLKQMKEYILSRHDWRTQRGHNDTSGYKRDCETARQVERCRTWSELEQFAPGEYVAAIANRCRLCDA